jgi:hypothetical protein
VALLSKAIGLKPVDCGIAGSNSAEGMDIQGGSKYDRDYLCVNKSQFVPVIFEPPCTSLGFVVCSAGSVLCCKLIIRLEESYRNCVCLIACVPETSANRWPGPVLGCGSTKKQKLACISKPFPDNVTHY